eukprot:6182283-Pleurochrysis_carterae.AAC.2
MSSAQMRVPWASAGNYVSDTGCAALAEALRHNTTLTEINVARTRRHACGRERIIMKRALLDLTMYSVMGVRQCERIVCSQIYTGGI